MDGSHDTLAVRRATSTSGSRFAAASRLAAAILVVAMACSGWLTFGPAAAPASASPGVVRSCPGDLVPATAFADTLGSPHRVAIDCASWFGLIDGRSPTSFAPGRSITRGQTAAIAHRLLVRYADVALDGDPSDVAAGFDDTRGHLFEAEIDALAALDILTGRDATTFDPDAPVSRAQFASVISRTLGLGFGAPLPAGDVPFTDVTAANPHRAAIGELSAAGIVGGTSATTYAPRRSVTREQAASFLTRTAMLLHDDGVLELPDARPTADDAYASRMRAAWVHLFDDQLKTRAGIDALVRELVAADATAVFAQVARRQDSYYDSDVLTRTVDPRVAPDFDVLAELVDAAHARGLEVHAWYGIAPTWHGVYDGLPQPSGWLTRMHGRNAPADDRWVTRSSSGTWSDYLDPGVPEVQDHVAAVVAELVERYPVDGIHLDYVRYSSASVGYNPKALEAFWADTGRSGWPDPDDAEWLDWRRDQSRALVQRSAAAIEAAGGRDGGRDVQLSAAVITWGDGPPTADRAGFTRSLPYTRTLQDWDTWVREGDLDLVLPMNYYAEHIPERRRWFDRWQVYQRALAATADVQVVPGPGGYLNYPVNAVAQVRDAMRIDGASVYSYQQPTLDSSRDIWARLAATRWGYHPQR